MRRAQESSKKGFTIIGFSLASIFIGTLLITIALVIMHVTSIYQKGLSIKAVNEVGEDLIDDIRRSISASSSQDTESICSEEETDDIEHCKYNAVGQTRIAGLTINGTYRLVPIGGAFCTGSYSYLWNSGYLFNDQTNPVNSDGNRAEQPISLKVKYQTGSYELKEFDYTDFRLLKVNDPNRAVCAYGITHESDNFSRRYEVYGDNFDPLQMIRGQSDVDLALYDLRLEQIDYYSETGRAFYAGTFILGTIKGGADIFSNGEYCNDKPDNLNSDFAYCAINKFNFAARATREKV